MRRLFLNLTIAAAFVVSAGAAEVQRADPRPAQLGMFLSVHHGGSPAAPSTWLRVEQVAPGAAAERGGLRAGDIITELNGEPVSRDEVDLLLTMAKLEIDKPAVFTVFRGSQRQTITVLPTRMSAAQYEQWKVSLAMLQAQRAQRAAAAAPK